MAPDYSIFSPGVSAIAGAGVSPVVGPVVVEFVVESLPDGRLR